MAIFYVEHSYTSAKRYGPQGAMKGTSYITRPSHADYVYSIGFKGTAGHKPTREQLMAQTQAISDAMPRKDARISHTIKVALPIELTLEQQKAAVRAYAWTITKGGQASCIAAIHDADSHNPHLHVALFDRRIEIDFHQAQNADTGKWERRYYATVGESVNKLTHKPRERKAMGLEPNATKWLRKNWELVGNDHLEAAGHKRLLDCRSYEDQGLDREPGQHLGRAFVREQEKLIEIQEDAPNRPDLHLEQETGIPELLDDVEPQEVGGPYDEEDDVAEPRIETGVDRADITGRLQSAAAFQVELNILREQRANLQSIRSQLADAEATHAKAHADSVTHHKAELDAQNTLTLADKQLSTYLRGDRLRGFSVPVKLNLGIWKFEREFKSPTRKAAEHARGTVDKAQHELWNANLNRADAEFLEARAERAVTEYRRKAEALEAQLRDRLDILGTEQELDLAETTFQNTITNELSDIAPERLLDELENGRITEGQMYDLLHAMGRDDLIERWEEFHDKLEDRGYEH